MEQMSMPDLIAALNLVNSKLDEIREMTKITGGASLLKIEWEKVSYYKSILTTEIWTRIDQVCE